MIMIISAFIIGANVNQATGIASKQCGDRCSYDADYKDPQCSKTILCQPSHMTIVRAKAPLRARVTSYPYPPLASFCFVTCFRWLRVMCDACLSFLTDRFETSPCVSTLPSFLSLLCLRSDAGVVVAWDWACPIAIAGSETEESIGRLSVSSFLSSGRDLDARTFFVFSSLLSFPACASDRHWRRSLGSL